MTAKDMLVDAIVNMYHLSRHNREEVAKVVDKFWPEPEMKILWDRIRALEIENIELEDKVRQGEIE
ncbi:hypothetical protein [Zhongshania sp.]|uniref:hypothetical protein n=1 Tax=Zhongshania sp. TaxID=1971902 RepID=UPI0035670061